MAIFDDMNATSPLPPRIWAWRLYLVPLAAFLVVLCFVLLRGEFNLPLDDAYIHLSMAHNLSHGLGYGVTPHHPTSSSSAPGWVFFLVPFEALFGDSLFAYVSFGLLFLLLLVRATHKLARTAGLTESGAFLAATLTSLAVPLHWAVWSGMETPLYPLLFISALNLWLEAESLHDRKAWAGTILFALIVFFRPEVTILLPLGLFIFRWQRSAEERSWKRLEPHLLFFLLVVAGYIGFHFIVDGGILPTTFYVKADPEIPWDQRLSLMVRQTIHLLDNPIGFQPLAALLALYATFRLTGRDRVLVMLAALFWFFTPLRSIVTGNGKLTLYWGRYAHHLLPLLFILAAKGWESISKRQDRFGGGVLIALGLGGGILAILFPVPVQDVAVRLSVYFLHYPSPAWKGQLYPVLITLCGVGLVFTGLAAWRLSLRTAAAVALVGWSAIWLLPGAWDLAVEQSNLHRQHIVTARWIANNTPMEAVIAVTELGVMAYHSHRKIVDLVGLGDRHVAMTPFSRRAKESYRWAAAQGMTYAILYDHWFPIFLNHPEAFRLVHQTPITQNLTFGGNDLRTYEVENLPTPDSLFDRAVHLEPILSPVKAIGR